MDVPAVHGPRLRDGADFARWMRGHARQHGFDLDATQLEALDHFRRLYDDLVERARPKPLLRRFMRKRPVTGLYLWGRAGRGKSFLMDSFFGCALPVSKERIHFHRFMQHIHHQLAQRQGESDPLSAIAYDLAKRARLICLDEFHVADIADAMLLGRLLEALFERGTVLVATSNQPPKELYRDGLQRARFLPAIELIERHSDVVLVDDGIDYRLRALESAGVYHLGGADRALERAFLGVARHAMNGGGEIEIDGRSLAARSHAQGIVWFDFETLCGAGRGKPDYIELARRYHTVIVSGIPRFTPAQADRLQRFVWMIDEFYDRRVKLIASAEAVPQELCVNAGGEEFECTVSRLTEMQSRDYLGQPHLA
ncbi:MAG TPA: cell division protein ZapE [Burkholderiales bacterium]|nr:cell division protein ZapE [Burkholderiales bacterium]